MRLTSFEFLLSIKIWGGHLLAIASERLLAQGGEMAVEPDPKPCHAVEIPGLDICRGGSVTKSATHRQFT